MKFSLEIGPQTGLESLPKISDVYITFLPGGNYKETTEIKKLCSSCSFWSHVSVQKSPDYETLKLTSYYNNFHTH